MGSAADSLVLVVAACYRWVPFGTVQQLDGYGLADLLSLMSALAGLPLVAMQARFCLIVKQAAMQHKQQELLRGRGQQLLGTRRKLREMSRLFLCRDAVTTVRLGINRGISLKISLARKNRI